MGSAGSLTTCNSFAALCETFAFFAVKFLSGSNSTNKSNRKERKGLAKGRKEETEEGE
jgi:hypothetical protein